MFGLALVVSCVYCMLLLYGKSWSSCQIRKIAVPHAPGMPGTFPRTLRVSDPDMHHDTYVTRESWCMPGSLISGFRWSQWRGKRSRNSRCMRNPQLYVSGKRPMETRSPIVVVFTYRETVKWRCGKYQSFLRSTKREIEIHGGISKMGLPRNKWHKTYSFANFMDGVTWFGSKGRFEYLCTYVQIVF